MPHSLLLADTQTAADFLTFAGRAARIADEGIRLQAAGGVLRMSAATLAPQGLLDATPTVIGMRILAADPELVCDITVPAQSLQRDPVNETAIALPKTALNPAWTGVAPPQTGWELIGTISAEHLSALASHGISIVAGRVPSGTGEEIVRSVRASVWGPLDDTLFDAPRGVAFTADALGFISSRRPGEEAAVFRAGRWTRFSTPGGHVLSRGPARVGLTDVRRTGAAV